MDAVPAKTRPDLTQKGTAMVGDMRTDALHVALRDEPIDDARLIALLVLAFAGSNVEVKTGLVRRPLERDSRAEIAGLLTEGGAITSDHALLHKAARAMLAYALSCRENWSQSGAVARIAGDAIGADAHLPNMATADFLSCLSKAAVEGVALGLNVPVQPTGKATRGAVIARVGEGRWVYPQALFSGSVEAMAADAASERRTASWTTGTADADADDPADTLPDQDGLDDGEDTVGTDPADDAGAGLEDEPEPEAEPIVPPRRRRLHKGTGEDRAAA
jgi:ParB family chromosome partitioning protein